MMDCFRVGASRRLQVELIVVCNDSVVGTSSGDGGRRLRLDQYLPSVVSHLQLVEIERGKIVHEVAFDLATKDVDLGAENVERVAVATRGSGT